MPLFMDVHEHLPEGATAADVADAHAADLRVQEDHKVHYLKYWVDDAAGQVFCLAEAPDAESAARVHREATGSSPIASSRSKKERDARRALELAEDLGDERVAGWAAYQRA
jgi:Protein of unknown function (DUF4242)